MSGPNHATHRLSLAAVTPPASSPALDRWIAAPPAPARTGLAAWAAFALIAAAITLARLAVVLASPVELGPDEAQYWGWAQAPDWGYYSKPPLIAWVIAATTGLLGETEAAVRLAAPLLHGAGGAALFALARAMGADARAATVAGLTYLLMPAVALSSAVISTDALLIPLWCAALLALWRFVETGKAGWAVAWGAALGLAFLAKYAAIYALLGAGLFVAIDTTARARLATPAFAAGAAAFAAIVAPHLMWNAANGFATIGHVADNANWQAGAWFHPGELASFVGEQFGVFGPIAFGALLWGLATAGRRPASCPNRRVEAFLLCFVAPPLAIVAAQALISRAHANWAATAYPAAAVLVAFWLSEGAARRVAAANLALGAALSAVFAAFVLVPPLADRAGAADAFKRARGWEATAAAVQTRAAALGADAVAVDSRLTFHALSFYGDAGYRAGPAALGGRPVFVWRRFAEPVSHAEATAGLPPGAGGRLLLASVTPGYRGFFDQDFARVRDAGAAVIPLGPGEARIVRFYLAEGYDPAPRVENRSAPSRPRSVIAAR